MGKGATSRRYSEEFKRDAVALYRSSGKPLTVVAQQLGISDTSLGTSHVPHFSEPFYVPHPSARSTRRISAASSSAVSSLILRPRST